VPYVTEDYIKSVLAVSDNPKAASADPKDFFDNRFIKELEDTGLSRSFMAKNNAGVAMKTLIMALMLSTLIAPAVCRAADALVGIHSARVMSQSMPWMAQEAGLFKKYNIDFNLVFISSSSIVTAALLGGDAEMTITGAIGNVAAYVRGSTGRRVRRRRQEYHDSDARGRGQHQTTGRSQRKKKSASAGSAATRIISPSRRCAVMAWTRTKDVQFIQTGGDPETLAAFMSGSIDVANLTPPTDAQAIAKGYHYVIYGPDLKIPYAATAFVTKRSVIAKRPQVIDNFMHAMAETAKLMHTDREFVYKVLGKYLRISDRNVLDSAYNAEIKVLEPRLVIKPEALQATLDELAQTDPRAKKIKPQELIDTRYLDEMEKNRVFRSALG
jgi:ABC-type nitrate/sulfonate/bicarbonate transport system substrate-binding protein